MDIHGVGEKKKKNRTSLEVVLGGEREGEIAGEIAAGEGEGESGRTQEEKGGHMAESGDERVELSVPICPFPPSSPADSGWASLAGRTVTAASDAEVGVVVKREMVEENLLYEMYSPCSEDQTPSPEPHGSFDDKKEEEESEIVHGSAVQVIRGSCTLGSVVLWISFMGRKWLRFVSRTASVQRPLRH